MTIELIFALQFFMSLVVIGLLFKWLLVPWLAQQSPQQSLFWLILPHAFRHIGMVFLVPGVVASTMPNSFALDAAYGDLLAGFLALLALIGLRYEWRGALALVWLFNIVGTLDLFNALGQAEAIPHMGAAWYIPTVLVPLLLVTHFMIFVRLILPLVNGSQVVTRT